ncbi:MAG: hypothetical protein JKY37_10555 [Nannocystaceae bacterium]|nr:hypothetical protein [Nannocystaceae bacterium]
MATMMSVHIPHPVVRRFLDALCGPASLATATLLTFAPGCRNDVGSDDGPPLTVGQPTGDDGGDDGADNSMPTSAGTVGGTADDGGGFDDSSWEGTAFTGEIHGMLQFTFSPAHALRADDVVGIVGGFRSAESSWSVEDFYSPVVYFLPFPNVPAAADTTSFDMMLPEFDYGDAADWVTAGNGMVLRRTDLMGSVTACLQDFEVNGDNGGTFPIYTTGKAGTKLCYADPSAWESGIPYDVLLFGGAAFGDNELIERVTTPPMLEIESPNLAVVGELVTAGDGLTFTWGASEVESRIVFRIVDQSGAVLSAHAADDGDFSFSAADLTMLQPGPIDILVARERVDRMLFTDGGLTVVSRYERWGFFELEA